MLKKLWFQTHWLLGITAGVVLAVMGVSGALLSFEHDILRWLNPGVITVTPRAEGTLPPPELLARLQTAHPEKRISALNLYADPTAAARVNFQATPNSQNWQGAQQSPNAQGAQGRPGGPAGGGRRGEWRYVDPYSGVLLGNPRGQDFFRFTTELHRWLAMGETGKIITGASTIALVILCLSGLYLRWPRTVLDWRAWLKFAAALKGRSFLWHLHAVTGTWVLLLYLLAGLTGLYWSYEWYRNGLLTLTGTPPPNREAATLDTPSTGRPDLAVVWAAFLRETQGFSTVTLTLPEKPTQALEIRYLDPTPVHERASNLLVLHPASGAVIRHDRYAERPLGTKLINSMFVLHSGGFFGLLGLVLMLVASLFMPLFTITGWQLYLDRRAKKRAARATAVIVTPTATRENSPTKELLIGFASQSGVAERLAWQTAGSLQIAGMSACVKPLNTLGSDILSTHRRTLFIVSTFGDGEPPDNARVFARRCMNRSLPLAALQFGLLSLGDRHYRNFCGFGRDLDAWLRRQGAQALFTPIEVDNGNLRALQDWQQQLGMLTTGTILPAWQAARYGRWCLAERRLLNPGSRGGPTYHIALEALDPRGVTWEAGDVAEVLPHNSERQVAEILTALKQDGNTTVQVGGRSQALAEVLARSLLPTALNGDSPPHLAGSLESLPYRAYSISSLPQDGAIHLLVRQARREDGSLGLASGWLTEYAPVGAEIELRIRANPNFRLPEDDRPLILIGNGTGLAGLRGHLKGRALAGHSRNWLIFGERNADCDFYYREEIEDWQARDVLERVDLAFSRDQSTRVYVQHRLQAAADTVRAWLTAGAALYVCGSIVGMAPGVEAALTHIIGSEALERLAAEGRYHRDVY